MSKSNFLLNKIHPLTFPLLEKNEHQGFMWEREWRYPKKEGLLFSFSDIKIICCPENEEEAIRNILGSHAAGITFIRHWIDYDEVTTFLQERIKGLKNKGLDSFHKLTNIGQLKGLLVQIDKTIHIVQDYSASIKSVALKSSEKGISDQLLDMEKTRDAIREMMEKMQSKDTGP